MTRFKRMALSEPDIAKVPIMVGSSEFEVKLPLSNTKSESVKELTIFSQDKSISQSKTSFLI
jgi:hypothetical protein